MPNWISGRFLGKQKVGAEIVVNRVGEMTQKYVPLLKRPGKPAINGVKRAPYKWPKK